MDNLLSKGTFNEDKYTLKFIDRNKRILKVVEKNLGRESKKRVVSFSDSDLDEYLMNKKSYDLLYFIVLNFQVITKTKV